jgi:hypothetical protein
MPQPKFFLVRVDVSDDTPEALQDIANDIRSELEYEGFGPATVVPLDLAHHPRIRVMLTSITPMERVN